MENWPTWFTFQDKIKYIKGEDNTVADALSCVDWPRESAVVAPVLSIATDTDLLQNICMGYETDQWCKKLDNLTSTPEAELCDGLLY